MYKALKNMTSSSKVRGTLGPLRVAEADYKSRLKRDKVTNVVSLQYFVVAVAGRSRCHCRTMGPGHGKADKSQVAGRCRCHSRALRLSKVTDLSTWAPKSHKRRLRRRLKD